jgi:acetamidase/formamidase
MARHELPPIRPHLHGHVSRDLPPVLTIASGDTVAAAALDAMWSVEKPAAWPWKRVEPFDPVLDAGHCLVGPIAVGDTLGPALPGDAIEVRVDALTPGPWGWTHVWMSPQQQARFEVDTDNTHGTTWTVDAASLTATDDRTGRAVRLRPFLGWMGLMPDLPPGPHVTSPPRRTGGNLDCADLVAGTSLLLPVELPGGLFSFGDGHGLQGDGEVCGTALEVPMANLELTFVLHRRSPLRAPRAVTPDGTLCFGIGSTLDDATTMALNGALDLLVERRGVPRVEAMLLASLQADLRVTQIVNGTQGVHVRVPNELLSR